MDEFRIFIPVICHNGHEAIASYRLEDLDFIFESVPNDQQCKCPKSELGQGYTANGAPYTSSGNNLLSKLAIAREALKDITKMYSHAWDLVNGGLMMMPDSIPQFEKAHEKVEKALAAISLGEKE